jgi:hypothetical protein
MRNAFEFLAIIILCLLVPLAYYGLQNAQQEPYEQLAPSVVTGVGETTADITLNDLPEPNRASSITIITSTVATDIPVISNYNPTTKLLTVGGLTAETTRNLEITYLIEAGFLSQFWFMGMVFQAIIILIPIGLISIIVATVVNAWRNR